MTTTNRRTKPVMTQDHTERRPLPSTGLRIASVIFTEIDPKLHCEIESRVHWSRAFEYADAHPLAKVSKIAWEVGPRPRGTDGLEPHVMGRGRMDERGFRLDWIHVAAGSEPGALLLSRKVPVRYFNHEG